MDTRFYQFHIDTENHVELNQSPPQRMSLSYQGKARDVRLVNIQKKLNPVKMMADKPKEIPMVHSSPE